MTSPCNKRHSQIGQNKKRNGIQKQETKSNNLLQLKDQLVKMKQFLNQQMPVLRKLVSTQSQHQGKDITINPAGNGSLPHQQLIEIVNKNRRLIEQNEKLSQMLIRQRRLKQKLNNSLQKQERLLTNLYETTHRNLKNNHSTRNLSNNQPISIKLAEENGNHTPKKFQKLGKQKVNIRNNRSFSKQNLQKFISETSINAHHNYIVQNPKKVMYEYSSSEEQTILNIQQLNILEVKMQDLIKESQKTESRSKKLELRKQLQKIAMKITQLRNSLTKTSY